MLFNLARIHMSVLEPSTPSITNPASDICTTAPAPAVLMTENVSAHEKPHNKPSALTPHEHARALVRLVQCQKCSKPYRVPVTLPCGNSLCRQCLPEAHQREHVTYPDLPGRRRAVQCPFDGCAIEHTMADCCIDVTLTKVMEAIAEVVAKQNSLDMGTSDTDMKDADEDVATSGAEHTLEKASSITAPGRLVATYNLAAAGKLAYDADVMYDTDEAVAFTDDSSDEAVLAQLIDMTQKELDCQVCYHTMLDPVTTACGHTLCRRCLVRTLDHSVHCPVCRRMVLLPPSLLKHPSNNALVSLLNGLCPEVVAARADALMIEENIGIGDLDTPLFPVTLGFPHCPTFLRIFEPRYRLMLRRAAEGNRQFGILMYNRFGIPQGELGNVHFMEYGTMLHIETIQTMPDGQSIVETKGMYRFRVKRAGQLDGYSVGSVERVEDVPLAEEELLEVRDTSQPPALESDLEGQIDRMPTQELLEMGLNFIARMKERSAPWLEERILQAYGSPPHDAARFPYWFASILPINDEIKYQLLQTTSVRQRLKVTALWVKRMEAQRWYQNNACTVL